MTLIFDPYPSEPSLFNDPDLLIKKVGYLYYFFDKRYALLLRKDGITIFDMDYEIRYGRDSIIFRTNDTCRAKLDLYLDRDSEGRTLPSSKEKSLKEMKKYLDLLVFS